MNRLLYFFLYFLPLLASDILMSSAMADCEFNRKSLTWMFCFFLLSGLTQFVIIIEWGYTLIWYTYPLTIQLPVFLLLWIIERRPFFSSLASVTTAYLFCEPVKWFVMLCSFFSLDIRIVIFLQIVLLISVTLFVCLFLSRYLGVMFAKEAKTVMIFSMIPNVYYPFDYFIGLITHFRTVDTRLVYEFYAFFLCISFITFCIVYYKEYEQKISEQHKSELIQIIVSQQYHELNAIRRNEKEVRMIRHDMRLHLNNIASCLNNGDIETAENIINSLIQSVSSTVVKRYCDNNVVNYILNDFAVKCQEESIDFQMNIALGKLDVNEIMFSSILANALDNAFNAQKELDKNKRRISLILKNSKQKLLLSVRNPFLTRPVFKHGIPVSFAKDHGYGTQSICYMTEKLNGKYQFIVKDDQFMVRVII